MSILDLHMHSNYSRDGDFTPKELIELAKQAGLKYIALSDHNDMSGIDEMIKYGTAENIQVIPAIEFDTLFEGLEVHLLGYNFDYKKPYYQQVANVTINLMDEATHRRIVALENYFHITLDEEAILRDTKPGGNPFFTICTKMFEDSNNQSIPEFQPYLPGGEKSDPFIVNFFWDYCSGGKPCYVKVDFPDFKETIQRIHEDGGIAILAHPWENFYQNEVLLQKAIDAGIDGIEAYSNYHTADHNMYYEKYCRKHNLLFTCGSDFHGALKPSIKMGEFGYQKENQQEVLDAFLNKLNNPKQ